MANRKTLIANVVKPWTVKDGKLVAPVTLMKQGVMCGSGGCVLYKGDLIKASTKYWEGVPVVVNHPQKDGVYVSANQTPNEIIGHITKPYYDSFQNCLRGHVEISIAKHKKTNVQDLKEVSIGAIVDTDETAGLYFNKYYDTIATSMIPDHLALLQGQVGACSWEDGCGIRVNSCKCNDPYLKNMLIDMLAHAAANKINQNNYKLNNSEIMKEDEILMPIGLDGGTVEQPIGVNAWEESDVLPPTEIAFLINKAKNKNNSVGDEGEEVLMPTGY
jgi:hypothetical protein